MTILLQALGLWQGTLLSIKLPGTEALGLESPGKSVRQSLGTEGTESLRRTGTVDTLSLSMDSSRWKVAQEEGMTMGSGKIENDS